MTEPEPERPPSADGRASEGAPLRDHADRPRPGPAATRGQDSARRADHPRAGGGDLDGERPDRVHGERAAVNFACKLDAAPYARCASPISFEDLEAGAHSFSVRATDKAGNVGKPATVAWTYHPAGHDAAGGDDRLGAAGLDDQPRGDLHLLGERAGVDVRLLARRRRRSRPARAGSRISGSPWECTSSRCARPTSQATPASRRRHTWTIVVATPDLVVAAFAQLQHHGHEPRQCAAGPADLQVTLVSQVLNFKTPTSRRARRSRSPGRSAASATYRAIVDRTQLVAESDETNNTATLQNTCLHARVADGASKPCAIRNACHSPVVVQGTADMEVTG